MITSRNSSFELTRTPFHKQTNNDEENLVLQVLETPLDKINKTIRAVSGNSSSKKNQLNQNNSYLLQKKQRKRSLLLESNQKKNNAFIDINNISSNFSAETNRPTKMRHSSVNRRSNDHINYLSFLRCDTSNNKNTNNTNIASHRTIRNNIINITNQNIESPTSSSNFYDSNNYFNNNTFQTKLPTSATRTKHTNIIFPAPITDTPLCLLNKYNSRKLMNSKESLKDSFSTSEVNYSPLFISKFVSKGLLSANNKQKRMYKMEQKFHKILHKNHESRDKERIDLNYMCCDKDSFKKKLFNKSPRKNRSLIKGLRLLESESITKKTKQVNNTKTINSYNININNNKFNLDEEIIEMMTDVTKDVNSKIHTENGTSVVDIYLKETINFIYNID